MRNILNNKNEKYFNIGEASNLSGIHPKMIRHYETIGVLIKAKRSDSGYRLYNETDIHNLIFVKQARELGFSLEEIKKLLNLWGNKKRSSVDVKKLAMTHIEKLNQKITELKMMKNSLENLVDRCQGNDHPDCPILDAISTKK
ncbi:MAG: Cu(I)-responsive transcriptional regulator [Silvanigrellaceae bacterium]|nr:Cu(I)-responsive transcriptional regulator [Silvanigrellaceae bacterium]